MDGNSPLLLLSEVCASYGEIHVLKGVSCTVHKGRITCIIGANGAGKSTLLKTVFGIVPARAGKITFNSVEIIHHQPMSILKMGISYVPQGRCNFPQMSIRENLEMGAFTRKDLKQVAEEIERLYDEFPMLKMKDREMAGNLSGGQQQILEMAMALLLKPALLLIDEPSLGLDPRMMEQVFETITQIKDRGTAVLMVEQNAKKALSISDYAFVLELGRNWLDGSAQSILNDPKVRYRYLGL
ncbi:MAG: ABC transporter ATP-binding protein [Anaerolineales bacterium]|nr:ABC transporter ATP-binding protein [Anaerolineales bacterium]